MIIFSLGLFRREGKKNSFDNLVFIDFYYFLIMQVFSLYYGGGKQNLSPLSPSIIRCTNCRYLLAMLSGDEEN